MYFVLFSQLDLHYELVATKRSPNSSPPLRPDVLRVPLRVADTRVTRSKKQQRDQPHAEPLPRRMRGRPSKTTTTGMVANTFVKKSAPLNAAIGPLKKRMSRSYLRILMNRIRRCRSWLFERLAFVSTWFTNSSACSNWPECCCFSCLISCHCSWEKDSPSTIVSEYALVYSVTLFTQPVDVKANGVRAVFGISYKQSCRTHLSENNAKSMLSSDATCSLLDMRLPAIPRDKLTNRRQLLKDFFRTIGGKSGAICLLMLLFTLRTAAAESVSGYQARVFRFLFSAL